MSGDDRSDLGAGITRRDFVNTTLIGTGAALLHGCAPERVRSAEVDWNGFGGVGDYRNSNGNTRQVADAAHAIRDKSFGDRVSKVPASGESYDLVIIGGGFNGLGALHEFRKRYPNGTCLLLDNQAVFGGYAKPNEFDVSGFRIAGPQASLNFVLPGTAKERADSYLEELGLPQGFRFADREDGQNAIRFARSTSAPLYMGEQSATMGYFFEGGQASRQGQWVKDIWDGDLARAPWPDSLKTSFLAIRDRKLRGKPDPTESARLDGMTFADFAVSELGATPEVLKFITQGMCVTGPQISAYAARSLPGVDRHPAGSVGAKLADRFVSFPAGNAVLARYFVKAAIPDAFAGSDLRSIADAPIDFAALDRSGAKARIRLGSTALRVAHVGDPLRSEGVDIVYERGGKLARVRSKGVVLGIGSWVAKHIVADLPTVRRAVLDQFLYAPMLMINVALRNWRFLDKLGFSAARWFDGFGFYCNIRQPMLIGGRAAPFHPDKPIVMTFYVPIQKPDLPLEAQGPAARTDLYATPYADYERQLVAQMQRMFGSGGFDARRDIAGIVLNRWGHAFVTPPPGFFFGKDGAPAPLKLAAEPWGRMAFGQSGLDDWSGAARAGRRAVTELAHAL